MKKLVVLTVLSLMLAGTATMQARFDRASRTNALLEEAQEGVGKSFQAKKLSQEQVGTVMKTIAATADNAKKALDAQIALEAAEAARKVAEMEESITKYNELVRQAVAVAQNGADVTQALEIPSR